MSKKDEFPGVACMGGFCSVRTSCRRFHAEGHKHTAERLCSAFDTEAWQPITLVPPERREPAIAEIDEDVWQ